mmetsp:Transcript_3546/g.9025  ORF Transcript_3546/g.9025 Transcript_3546/m.9025 type:complete len:864 (-) Transcript_3546:182-2773(-)
MSDETRHTLQQLLRLALEAVCPAQAHLVESNAGCVKPSMKVGKVGGAGDYESRVALALYHNLAASQASGLRERSDGAEPGGVLVVSALGLLRRLSSAAELAAALLEALLDAASEQQRGVPPASQLADVCVISARGGQRCIISFTTAAYLRAQAAAGMLRCPACDCFFQGERGLTWHSLMKHKTDYEVSQHTAAEQSLALATWSTATADSFLAQVMRQIDASRPKKAAIGLDAGMRAARDGDLAGLRASVAAGWDPASVDRHGSNALLWAAGGGHLEVCEYLVAECGCSPQVCQARDGRNALHWAARNGHIAVVRWLVETMALDPDVATHDGTTALHWAAWQGHLPVVAWLVESARCRADHANKYGCTAVHWASQGTAAAAPQVVAYLLARGLSVTAQNCNGHTPLHKAAQRGHAALCRWLVTAEPAAAEVRRERCLERPDNDGSLPADCARLEGHGELSAWLAEAAAALEAQPSTARGGEVTVSIIVPVHNAEKWLDETLGSISLQVVPPGVQVEAVLWDDASTDGSAAKLRAWADSIVAERPGWRCKVCRTDAEAPLGCGDAKNAAVRASSGRFLMFQDADDVSHRDRLSAQLAAALASPQPAIVGARFERDPPGATRHYTAWANSLTPEQLHLQRFRECTLVAPTWFMSRETFDRSGGFGTTLGDDLQLFQRHCNRGGHLCLVGGGAAGADPLLAYRHHATSLSSATPRGVLLAIRAAAFVEAVLEGAGARGAGWEAGFTVWNAGRDGKQFVRALPWRWQRRCRAFCDVDARKIGTVVELTAPSSTTADDAAADGDERLESDFSRRGTAHHRVPVVHWSEAEPPLVLCVAMGRTNGVFEGNVAELAARLQLREGTHYWHFN